MILKNDVAVNGTFFHNQQGANGPEVVSGKLVDGVFKAGPSGQALLHGEVEIGAKAFEISKAAPASSGQDGTPPSNKTPDSKTNAVVVESEKAYSVSDGVLP